MTDVTVNWVFDDPERFITMSACPTAIYGEDGHNNDGRWNISNIHWYWRCAAKWYGRTDVNWNSFSIANRPKRYVYPIGAFSGPSYWSGMPGNPWGFPDMFSIIPSEVLADARDKRALIAIDNLNEGFIMPELWDFFHERMAAHCLPPGSVAYINSNLADQPAYLSHCRDQACVPMIRIIPFMHLMYQQQVALPQYGVPTWEDHILHKSDPGNRIRLYNCLNRRSHWHRELLVLKLIEHDLMRSGIVSCNSLQHDWLEHGFETKTLVKASVTLPAIADDVDFDNNKAMQCNPSIYVDSYISIITETHVADDDRQQFISEKIWKPIHCRHPFIALGNRNMLHALRDHGYRCDYAGWSSWDGLPFERRVQAIIDTLFNLRQQRDKIAWFRQWEELCEHNYQNFMRLDFFESPACDEFLKAYIGLAA